MSEISGDKTNPAGTDMHPTNKLMFVNGMLQQMWESENGLTGEWRTVQSRSDTLRYAAQQELKDANVPTGHPRLSYEYRFVAACGLERKLIKAGFNNYQSGLGPIKEWFPVEGKDFLSMTWEELEHVAHVIRDASRPKTEEA